MLMSVLSGLVVSIDALFIGVSLGLQKKCKFVYLVMINLFLTALCFIGFFIAEEVYELIAFDPDIIVGGAFIFLGVWTIASYVVSVYIKQRKQEQEEIGSRKTIIVVGIVMSVEAMLITMGLTFLFQPHATLAIPIAVAFAHFAYSAVTFILSRTKYVSRFPVALCHVISGLALVVYGLMALFVEISL